MSSETDREGDAHARVSSSATDPAAHTAAAQTSATAVPIAAQWIARLLLAAFAVALALIVLLPSDGHRVLGLVDVLAGFAAQLGVPYWFAFATIEFTANIALFVPFGVLLPLARGNASIATLYATVLAGAALSILIELAQLGIPGRVSTPADVLANTSGVVSGVALIHTLHRARARLR